LLTYETLDAIADSVNPSLGLIALAVALHPLVRQQGKRAASNVAALLGGVAIAYAVMLIDNVAGIWPHLGLDYSTHTAVALALVSFLTFMSRGAVRFIWSGLFAAYALLMLYQRYHTFLDILSTLVIVAPAVVLFHKGALRLFYPEITPSARRSGVL
jgi:hypothetical protein